MDQDELRQLRFHLVSALELVNASIEGMPAIPQSEHRMETLVRLSSRNPEYFRPTGHLSDHGVQALYALFDQDKTVEEAARHMKISVRGAAGRYAIWKKLRNR